MRVHAALLLLEAFSAIALARPQPAPTQSPTAWANSATVTPAPTRDDTLALLVNRPHGTFLQARDDTTTSDSETTSDSSTSTSESETSTSSESESTTSTSSSSTTESTTSSTSTSSTSTTSSTTSSTSTSSSSSSTTSSTSTKTTSTSSTTSSTSTSTSTTSAEMKAYNHRGSIAAIITFSIVGAAFVGIIAVMWLAAARKKRRQQAAKELLATADAQSAAAGAGPGASSYSMVPLSEEPKFDRASLMFAPGGVSADGHSGAGGSGSGTPRTEVGDPLLNHGQNQSQHPMI